MDRRSVVLSIVLMLMVRPSAIICPVMKFSRLAFSASHIAQDDDLNSFSKIRGPICAYSVCLAVVIILALTTSGDAARKTNAALLVIDVQDCFLSGGSLAVNEGNDVIPVINWIRKAFKDQLSLVALTKDWHCDRHVSFVTSHTTESQVGDVVNLRYNDKGTLCLGGTITPSNFPGAVTCPAASGKNLTQVLWPVHCVQGVGTGPTSSSLDDSLTADKDDVIVTKGTNCQVDSYSAFYDNGRFGMTALDSVLKSAGIDTIFVTGLALDYCVKFTALDGKFLGYDVYVIVDATRGVTQATSDQALEEFRANGIHVIDSVDLSGILVGAASGPATFSTALIVLLLAAHLLL